MRQGAFQRKANTDVKEVPVVTAVVLVLLCACVGYLVSIERLLKRSLEILERIEKQGK